jgi:hypothetical protein
MKIENTRIKKDTNDNSLKASCFKNGTDSNIYISNVNPINNSLLRVQETIDELLNKKNKLQNEKHSIIEICGEEYTADVDAAIARVNGEIYYQQGNLDSYMIQAIDIQERITRIYDWAKDISQGPRAKFKLKREEAGFILKYDEEKIEIEVEYGFNGNDQSDIFGRGGNVQFYKAVDCELSVTNEGEIVNWTFMVKSIVKKIIDLFSRDNDDK